MNLSGSEGPQHGYQGFSNLEIQGEGDKVAYAKECSFRRCANALAKVAFGGQELFGAATTSQYLKTKEETRANKHTTLILTSHVK